MTIGELFNNMAIKAGIAVDNAELKTLLASPELATINVPDPLVTYIENGLLSLEAAKNNHPDIKKKYFADAYDGIDKQLMALVATDTFDAADVEEIKLEKSTSKKQELIISKLKTAAKTAKGADKDEINRQLAAAHDEARKAKEEKEQAVKDGDKRLQETELKYAKRGVLSTYKTIYDDMDPVIKMTTMEALLSKALQDKNAEFKTDENGNLTLVSKDGSNVFGDNHVQLTPQKLFDTTFAPILKVSGPPKPAAKPNGQQPPVKTSTTDAERHVEANADFVKSHADKVLADFGQAPASMI